MSPEVPLWRDALQQLVSETSLLGETQPLALQIESGNLVALRPDTSGNWSTRRASWRDLNSSWVSVTSGLDSTHLQKIRHLHEVAALGSTLRFQDLGSAGQEALAQCLRAGVQLFANPKRQHILLPVLHESLFYLEFEELRDSELRFFVRELDLAGFESQDFPGFARVPAFSVRPQQILQEWYTWAWEWKLDSHEAAEFWATWAKMMQNLGLTAADFSEMCSRHSYSPPRLVGVLRVNPQNNRQLEIAWSVQRYTASGEALTTDLQPDLADASLRSAMKAVVSACHLNKNHWEDFFQQRFPIWELQQIRSLVAEINTSGRAEITESPELEGTAVFESGPQIEMTLDAAPGQNSFVLSWDFSLGTETLNTSDFLAALHRSQRWWRSPQGNWVDLYAARLTDLRQILQTFRDLGLQEFQDGTQVKLKMQHLGLVEHLEKLAHKARISAKWQDSLQALLNPESHSVAPPSLASGSWRDYQVEGFHWLQARAANGLGGILADDMGLGKTMQMLGLVASQMENNPTGKPVFVVVPASLLGTWEEQISRWFPQLRPWIVAGSLGKNPAEIENLRQRVEQVDIVVTTYTLARMDMDFWSGIDFAGLIFDEAQTVKNPTTATHRALTRLQAPWAFAMTGTPIENSPTDMWSILALTVPNLLPRLPVFTRSLAATETASGRQQVLANFASLIRPFLLRRTKDSVARELPQKIEQRIVLEMKPSQSKMYAEYLELAQNQANLAPKNQMNILTSLLRLRQIALSARLLDAKMREDGAKIDYLLDSISSLIGEGHQILVFSQFTKFLNLLRQRLNQAGLKHTYLDGSSTDRSEQVRSFQTGEVDIFLISLKAGGFGLNLTAADYVFLCDPWWNPAVEAQAIDRAHRLGQARSVNVYRLVSRATIEERVLELQAKKREMISAVLSSSENRQVSAQISGEELRGLLLP